MRRTMIASLALAVLCLAGRTMAQEKVAPPAKSEAKAAVAATVEACADDCLHKVCVAVPDKKKITKVEYACKEKDICLPRCSFGGFKLGHGRGCNDACGDACGHAKACKNPCPDEGCTQCGKPRTVRVLMKRSVTTECPTTKCEVVLQPAQPKCATSCRPVCTDPCVSGGTIITPGTTTTMPRATSEAAPLPLGTAPTLTVEPQQR